MTEYAKPAFRVYSPVPGAQSGEEFLNIGLAIPHQDGLGYDVMLQALPINPRIILRDAGGRSAEVGQRDSAHPVVDKHLSLREQLDTYERMIIEQCLIEAAGKLSEVMQRLNIPRRTLSEKMTRLGIVRSQFTKQPLPPFAPQSERNANQLDCQEADRPTTPPRSNSVHRASAASHD